MKEIISRVWRAIIEFDLIEANDRILIGFIRQLKDSLFLTHVLAQIRRHSARPVLAWRIHHRYPVRRNISPTRIANLLRSARHPVRLNGCRYSPGHFYGQSSRPLRDLLFSPRRAESDRQRTWL